MISVVIKFIGVVRVPLRPPLGLVWLLLACLSLSFCASKNCVGRKAVAPLPKPEEIFSNKPVEQKRNSKDFAVVFKYDGSLQCGMGSGTSTKKMGEELAGIKIYKAEKKSDGLMHIQVCGSPTGSTNVYTIPIKDLPIAKKLGFKVWRF